MIEYFKKQLEESFPITQEMLEQLGDKKYENGDLVNVGDTLLYGLLTDEDDVEPSDITLKLIRLNERHFHLYEFVRYEMDASTIPTIKLTNIRRKELTKKWADSKVLDGLLPMNASESKDFEIYRADSNQIIPNDELYSQVEGLIIEWSNNGTKTAGELTREIIKLI